MVMLLLDLSDRFQFVLLCIVCDCTFLPLIFQILFNFHFPKIMTIAFSFNLSDSIAIFITIIIVVHAFPSSGPSSIVLFQTINDRILVFWNSCIPFSIIFPTVSRSFPKRSNPSRGASATTKPFGFLTTPASRELKNGRNGRRNVERFSPSLSPSRGLYYVINIKIHTGCISTKNRSSTGRKGRL